MLLSFYETLMVHYRVQNSSLLAKLLDRINPPCTFYKIQFNVILPFMPWFSKWSLSLLVFRLKGLVLNVIYFE